MNEVSAWCAEDLHEACPWLCECWCHDEARAEDQGEVDDDPA